MTKGSSIYCDFFPKVCDMCDASTGSLSSYAYILMLIHFLQRLNVLPVLQQVQVYECMGVAQYDEHNMRVGVALYDAH